ncbi:hypothetical protein [Kribbella sp. NPDC006257]|uniref:hypothetical protein n=1 Tax=Kribbella sp. NPDC006257 TaxID=3156738 RepID=UPI0033BF496E
MTDLKHLLDHAAGDEPVLTDADLTADLTRGHRSLRRRRFVGIAGTATGTVAAIGVALSVGAPWNSPVAGGTHDGVRLVLSGKALPGAKVWCDLKPAGWTPIVRPSVDGQYRLEILPPSGGDPLVVTADDELINSFDTPPSIMADSVTLHRFTDSCHTVK